MKTLKYILASFVLVAGMSSCVGDLNIDTPLDPSLNTADKALTTVNDYEALLASIYTGFATSGYEGANGGPSISGLDGGTSQYFRGRHYLNGHPTDELICGWNDPGVPDMYPMTWTVDNVVVASFYYRICHQVSLSNEFIRQVNAAKIDLPEKARWIAEARALRAFCWLDGIDNYGNMPFADETFVVGSKGPDQIKRADLFTYIESECKELLEGNDLYGYAEGPYGRVNKGFVAMVLAKLYLNAEVYIGQKKYQECVNVLKALEGKYTLHTKANGTKYNAFQDLFLADNHTCTDEVIWAIQQDGENTTSWGVTTYLVRGYVGGTMDPGGEFGVDSGWGGPRATPQYYSKFTKDDARNLFHTDGQDVENIELVSDFSYGAAYAKYRNINSDGTPGKAKGHVDTDFPVFRYADALLMLAECELKGATGANGLAAFNQVRERAGVVPVKELNASDLLDERARELALEGWRRSDLIRFGKFTSGYNWAWKGGVKDGKDMPSHLALFPIPLSDMNANDKLEQNLGY